MRDHLINQRSGVSLAQSLGKITGMRTRLTADVPEAKSLLAKWQAKHNGMGRVAALAAEATQQAIDNAGWDFTTCSDHRTGLFFGSTSGSPPAIETLGMQLAVHQDISKMQTCHASRLASNTTALNLVRAFGLRGRVQATCSACTSGSQAIGFAVEAIRWGLLDRALAGGGEESHVICHAVFDIMQATSTRNDGHASPRPFDRDRDGLVVGEGAATLALEDYESARRRGAIILAEIAGFATNSDGRHMVNPCSEAMHRVQASALANAGISAHEVDYVNAHGTATDVGDIAETQATAALFGNQMPISSLKSYMGHTLGACGAIEAFILIHAMNEGWLPPTLHLDHRDERCAELDYIREVRDRTVRWILSNNFAFGGVNTSLLLKNIAGC